MWYYYHTKAYITVIHVQYIPYNQLAAFGRFLRKNTGEYDGAKEGCAQLFYN